MIIDEFLFLKILESWTEAKPKSKKKKARRENWQVMWLINHIIYDSVISARKQTGFIVIVIHFTEHFLRVVIWELS